MTSLNFAISIKLNYTNDLRIYITKENQKRIEINQSKTWNHGLKKPITPKTLLKDIIQPTQHCSLTEANFTCNCEDNSFYQLDINFDPAKNGEESIENLVAKIEKHITMIPKETTSSILMENIKTEISLDNDYLVADKVYSYIDITKNDNSLEDFETCLSYNDQNAFFDLDNKKQHFNLADQDAAKKNIDNILKNIIATSNTCLTEHERITMMSEIQKQSHQDLILIMKTRYHHYTNLEKECQKILKNTQ